MGKPVKRWLHGRRLVILKTFLVLIPLAYFSYRPVLRMIGGFLVVSDEPSPADAIVVLAGGDPGRALEAADLYKLKLAHAVVITTERPSAIHERARKDGVQLVQSYENYLRVLQGYGVPAESVFRIDDHVLDTLDEIRHVRDFVRQKGWTRLIVVTSNYHTRRSRMACRYVLAPDIQFSIVASHYDSFKPQAWWTSQEQARTFAIEFEKLVTYTLYIWPRMIWKTRDDTKPQSTSSVVSGSF